MVSKITDPERKAQIARSILEALTDWFGVEESREDYIEKSREWDFFAAMDQEKPVGFLCLKETGKSTVELAVMGVLAEYHRHGVGRALFDAAKQHAVAAGYEFMQVKTVKMGCYEDYDRTNRFYLGMGFKELEVFPLLWDEANPCQIYVQSLSRSESYQNDMQTMPENKQTTSDNTKAFLNLILHRHSYRGKFKPDPITREDLTAILEAGLAAPSGCNKQTTSLIAVDDPEVLAKLHAVIDPPVGETAPAAICVLTQRIVAYRDRCFAVQDYSAAIENILLAASALGYQSCWYEGHITDLDRIGDQMAKILNVPEGYELICFLPIGIAEDEPAAPKKKTFEERAWFNGFMRK